MIKSYLISSLLYAVAASTALSPWATMMPGEKPARIINVKPRFRAEAQRQQIRFGPLVLPPSKTGGSKTSHKHGVAKEDIASILSGGLAMDPDGFPFSKQLEGGFCTDCTVLAAKADVVFENGTRADVSSGVYLHHVVSSLAGKTQPQWISRCPAGASSPPAGTDLSKLIPGAVDLSKLDLSKLRGGAGFIGGAVDSFTDLYTSPDGKFNSGYYIPPGVKASMSGEIINYLKEDQKVYIQFDLEFVPGHVGQEAVKAAVSVEGCNFSGGSAFKKGPRGTVVSKDFDVIEDGTIISFRGHTHDGGVSVAAFVNNKLACNSTAVYGLAGGELTVDGRQWKTISKMTECHTPTKVVKGDIIRLEATYDMIEHPARVSQGEEQENMGFMQMTLVLAESRRY